MTNDLQQAVTVKKKGGISPVWILPIVALLIGGWLLFTSIRDDGVDITISFNDATGLVAGKTQVIFKGIPVGLVEYLSVDEDLKRVIVHVEMVKESRERLVEDMRFWVVKPEISTNRIAGLDTLFGGSYITLLPGKSTIEAHEFTGLESPPPLPLDIPGLRLTLVSMDAPTVDTGSAVYYRKVQVGEVSDVELNDEKSQVEIDLLIYEDYASLINDTTVFWNASGLNLEASLSKVRVQMDSLASLLTGGIAFSSLLDGGEVDTEQPFTLYETRNDAVLSRGSRLVFYFEGEDAVNVGASIRYKGVDVGEIVQVDFARDLGSFMAVGYAYRKARELFKDKSHVWMVQPNVKLTGISNIDAAIKGSYLRVEPGGKEFKNEFTVQLQPPVRKEKKTGLTIILEADRPGSLGPGAPIYYRQIKIGEVLHRELAVNSKKVLIYVGIKEKYKELIRDSSSFWNASGITFSGGVMSGFNMNTESLESILTGGVAMAIPDSDIGRPVENLRVFTLLKEPVAGWDTWSPEIMLDGSTPIPEKKEEPAPDPAKVPKKTFKSTRP